MVSEMKFNMDTESTNAFALEQCVEQIKRSRSAWLEYMAIDAELKAEKFKQLKKHGFSDDQAIELCKGTLAGG